MRSLDGSARGTPGSWIRHDGLRLVKRAILRNTGKGKTGRVNVSPASLIFQVGDLKTRLLSSRDAPRLGQSRLGCSLHARHVAWMMILNRKPSRRQG